MLNDVVSCKGSDRPEDMLIVAAMSRCTAAVITAKCGGIFMKVVMPCYIVVVITAMGGL